MRLTRVLVPLLLAGIVLTATAPVALAHTELESSSPSEGQSLATAPTSVTLTFGEAVTLPTKPVTIMGPGGTAWTVGAATIAGAKVTLPVQPSGPAGAYTLNYTVIADDGDQVRGAVHFTLSAAATPTTTAAPTTMAAAAQAAATSAPAPVAAAQDTGGGGVPVWVWVLIAAVVVALVMVLVLRTRGRSTPRS